MAPSKTTSSHLALLADTTLTSLYERERLVRLGSHPSTSDDAEIRHSLDTLKLGLGQLEKELEDLERAGAHAQDIKQREDVVIKLQSQVPQMIRRLTTVRSITDDDGWGGGGRSASQTWQINSSS
jgi:hypothetical protein